MNRTCIARCPVVILALGIILCSTAYAETTVTSTGITAASRPDAAQQDRAAFEDALYKAYLETALRYVPAAQARDLPGRLTGFVSSRGDRDVIRYKVVSRSQMGPVANVTFEIVLDETPLREWLMGSALTTPTAIRPKILLMVTTRGPKASPPSEWWSSPVAAHYGPFEVELASRLRTAGEYVLDPPVRVSLSPSSPNKARELGLSAGADIVVTGVLTHSMIDASSLSSRIDIRVIDIRSGSQIASFGVSLRGTVDVRLMNELLAAALMDPLKAAIASKVAVFRPDTSEKTICMEDVRDIIQYREILSALHSLGGVTDIRISGFQGKTVCHKARIEGSLTGIMEGLRSRLPVEADVSIREDEAMIRVLR